MSEVGVYLAWGAFWALLCLGLGAVGRPRQWRWLLLAALVSGLHKCALVLPPWTFWLACFGLDTLAQGSSFYYHSLNWVPKAAGVLLSGLVVFGLRWVTPAEAGLRGPQYASLQAVAPAVAIAATLLLADAYFSRQAFTVLWWPEQVFYSLVPGLEEEVFYRGVLLGLLNRVFSRTLPLPGTRTSWGGLLSVVLFGLGHVVHFPRDFTMYWHLPYRGVRLLAYGLSLVDFASATLLFTGSMGLLFLWVRERTNSVWPAVAAHCLFNTMLTLGHALP